MALLIIARRRGREKDLGGPRADAEAEEGIGTEQTGKGGGERFFCAHSSPFPFPTTLPLSELVAGRGRGPREGEGGGKKLSLRRSPIHQRDLHKKCHLDIGLPRESKLWDTLYFVYVGKIPAPPWRGRKMNYRRRSGSIPHGGEEGGIEKDQSPTEHRWLCSVDGTCTQRAFPISTLCPAAACSVKIRVKIFPSGRGRLLYK